ncbi:MAG TPA: aspartate aminotransferase family protein [Burkholderiales bacterium]|nr:aspartate aminotransferase family protein [Burkholderiales bacterium]
MNTYARLPVSFVRGEGCFLCDAQGRRYLDALAGIAVSTLGHAHPRLTAALSEQAARFIHCSNLYRIEEQEVLAAKLCALAQMDNAFFCTSGAEANEAAIKLARAYGHQRGIDVPTIVVMEKSFHGRTMATLTASGNRKVQAGFEPLLPGFARVPYNDSQALESAVANNQNIVAVLVEPVQGEGGVNIAQPQYLRELRELCDRYGWLLMLDEVQSGIARTGRWFAHQHAGIVPDVITLAKGLGSGVPIGACLARGEAAQVLKPGTHGSTFGGSPFSCRAALTTLSVIEDERLLSNSVEIGGFIHQGLARALNKVAGVVEIRGQGLMIGIELDRRCMELMQLALKQGLLINVTAENTIRLLPPLIIKHDEAKLLVDTLGSLVREFLAREAQNA